MDCLPTAYAVLKAMAIKQYISLFLLKLNALVLTFVLTDNRYTQGSTTSLVLAFLLSLKLGPFLLQITCYYDHLEGLLRLDLLRVSKVQVFRDDEKQVSVASRPLNSRPRSPASKTPAGNLVDGNLTWH